MRAYLNKLVRAACRTPLDVLTPIGRSVVWSHPACFWTYYWGRYGKLRPKADEYDLWVDGFPRSANTYLRECMTLSFPKHRIISHIHAPFVATSSLARSIPGILLIRHPRPAVLSYAIATGHKLHTALDYYVKYYRRLTFLKERFFVADFEQITADAHDVLQRFARQYSLAPPVLRDQLSARALLQVDQQYQDEHGRIDPMTVARPAAQRVLSSRLLEKKLDDSKACRLLLRQAEALYEQFSS